jgi:hypothetical protein
MPFAVVKYLGWKIVYGQNIYGTRALAQFNFVFVLIMSGHAKVQGKRSF